VSERTFCSTWLEEPFHKFAHNAEGRRLIYQRSDRLSQWANRWFSTRGSSTHASSTRIELIMLERDHLTVNSCLEELACVQQWFRSLISRLAEKTPWIDDQFDQLNLALAEGFTNAVRHAHAGLPGDTPIEIELVLQSQQIEICIFDQGEPFDPNSLSEPQPGSLREGGYGWFLLRRLADQVTYVRLAAQASDVMDNAKAVPRNCLRIVKTSKAV